ncbi:Bet v I domain-containing protein [Cynara cardunculus var. scolymus]|uniref:Bet v I domain-containing protein n=1 Tax=Cynara cardunculus var. scolymus TaxID=59895 RepID=A0A103YAA7_CYNCS|nr:Bet v I domain-containing protein [Cynara cardunculus var. scolymus]
MEQHKAANIYVIEAADEKNKWITFRMLDGKIMQAFKSVKVTIHVNKKGENSLVTWSFEYEKMKEAIPDPDALIDLANKVTKDVNNHQF